MITIEARIIDRAVIMFSNKEVKGNPPNIDVVERYLKTVFFCFKNLPLPAGTDDPEQLGKFGPLIIENLVGKVEFSTEQVYSGLVTVYQDQGLMVFGPRIELWMKYAAEALHYSIMYEQNPSEYTYPITTIYKKVPHPIN